MNIAKVRKMIEKAGAKLTFSRLYGSYFAWVPDAEGRVVNSGRMFTKDELESMGTDCVTKNVLVPLFPDFYCEDIATDYSDAQSDIVATASYKTGHVYSDGKAQRAIGYSIGGRFVMSLPARLNGGRIPSLEECAEILAGDSVKESDGVRNAAHHLGTVARSIVSDTVARLPGSHVGAALTVTGDGTTAGVKYVMWHGKRSHTLHAVATSPARLAAHWSGFVDTCAALVAPRVDLSKPAVPDNVASIAVFPQEPNAHIMERTRATLAERRTTDPAHVYTRMIERRRASVPAVVVTVEEVEHVDAAPPPVADPGNPCDMCGACLHEGQANLCDDCRQIAPAVVNLYQCPICSHEWQSEYTHAVPEDCPACLAGSVAPFDSEEVTA
jgi:hypothetical protein